MKNIHITLTEFRNESRLIKEVLSLEASELFDSIMIIALGAYNLPSDDVLSPKVKVRRINLLTRMLPKASLFQLVKLVEFMLRCLLIARRENVSIVNVHTLALLPLGWMFKIIFGAKLVYDTHELETEKNGLRGLRKYISKKIESLFINSCDLIFVVGDNIAGWYAKSYMIKRPIVVKNAPRSFQRTRKDVFRKTFGILPGQKILLYQGGLMKGRGVRLILEAFKERKDNDIVVIFMGYGDLKNEVKHAADVYPNIFYLQAVPPDVVLNYTSSADIGITLIENTCLSYYYCMPNKLFEYAMAGLPVIISNMKEMAEAVQSAGFGVVLNEYNTESINAAVDSLLERDLSRLSENAYQYALANSWEYQEKRLLESYQRLLKQ